MKTEIEKQDQDERILALRLTLQSVKHQIEDISRNEPYRHEMKQRTENYYAYIDKYTETFYKQLEKECKTIAELKAIDRIRVKTQMVVAKFDKLAASIKINK